MKRNMCFRSNTRRCYSTGSLFSHRKLLHTCSSFAAPAKPLLACHSTQSRNGAIYTQYRHVHEQPFMELPPDVTKNEAYEVARDALLQLNIMIRRGIEPDVLMYTTLIATMGRAKLEWQAYKLFSRMIEQNLRPLPETYVALYEATSPKREKLRAHIQTKMEDAIEQLPEQLAQEEQARRKEEDRWCVLKFEEYMRGELPQLPVQERAKLEEREKQRESSSSMLDNAKEHKAVSNTTNSTSSSEASSSSSSSSLENSTRQQVEPVATMRIRNPTDAWRVAEMAEEQREVQRRLTPASAREELRLSLSRLHEEELRIYLAIHKQLRHGNKEELITRILKSVAEDKIRSMLARRAYYFRSVGDLLEADLEELKMSTSSNEEEESDYIESKEEKEETIEGEELEEMEENVHDQSEEKLSCNEDETLSNAESKQIEPEILYTPWGILRKPRHGPPTHTFASLDSSSSSGRNMARLEKVRLVAEELLLIRHKAEVKELDELPESLLRRYAYQFQLHWRHKQPLSLHNAVEWHVTHFLPPKLEQKGQEQGILSTSSSYSESNCKASPTPAIRLQMEDEGMRRSMENYEAFRIIAQRTNNLQVVDHKEINAHLQNVERQILQSEQHAADEMRREQNLLNAASLTQSARSYTPPLSYVQPVMKKNNNNTNDDTINTVSQVNNVIDEHDSNDDSNGQKEISDNRSLSHILGMEPINKTIEEDNENIKKTSNDQLTLSSEANSSEEEEQEVNELPPWAMFGSEDEFNLTTGRFGDPSMGRYRELSDSNLRILPSPFAQQQWRVDRQLLPSSMRDVVHELELVQQKKRDAIEAEYSAKLQYNKYRKWDKLIQRATEKKAKFKEESAQSSVHNSTVSNSNPFASKPLPTKRRHVQLLRAGVERQRMSTSDIAKYNKSL